MKQKLLLVAIVFIAMQKLSAQTVLESKISDNWYIGNANGLSFKTTGVSVLDNLNPSMGMRLGKWFTPVFGVVVDGEAFLDNKGSAYKSLGTFVKGLNLSLLGTTNLSNCFGGYLGEPRSFEIVGVYGLGWGHLFSNSSAPIPGRNTLTSKVGLDFIFNMGSKKSWQLYLEPHITYALSDWDNKVQFDVNSSSVGFVVGMNYKLGNSDGTYNFMIADICDASELTLLNSRINELREKNELMSVMIDERDKSIADLRDALSKSELEAIVIEENTDVLLPVIVFKQNKSVVDASQLANLSLIASYMRENENAKMIVRGYASVEGTNEVNRELSQKRADAVKEVLVSRFMVKPEMVIARGEGPTNKLFNDRDLNRVVVFVIE